MAMSNYLENASLQLYLNANSVWLALFNVIPNDDGTGGTELAGSGYFRAGLVPGSFTVVVGATTRAHLTAPLIFPTATAPWVTANAIGVYDAFAGGNLLYYGNLTIPRTAAFQEALTFVAGTDFGISQA